MNIKDLIASLPEPKIFTTVKIEEIIKENVDLMKELNPDWKPIESDSNMMQLEAFSYKELNLKIMFNNAIKAMLPHYAKTEEDLDNFAFGFYGGETRLKGEEPTAYYEFFIEEALSVDITIPKGFILSNGDKTQAFLTQSVVIKAGELKSEGLVKLDLKIKESDIKTETIVSPYPYVLKPKAKDIFKGGSSKETNEEFISRAILSLYKYSTAGGEKAYIYFAKTADERVEDVKINSPKPLEIEVIIKATDAQEADVVVSKVDEKLNGDEKTQSFCDVVTVKAAIQKEVTLTPTIYLIDMLAQADTLSQINENFTSNFKIAESLPYSKIIKKLEVQNVYKVELPISDLNAASNEVLNITITPTFKKAEL